MTQFRWKVDGRSPLSGTRPLAADWYRLNPPGWFAGEGWGLTPETGGIAQAGKTGVDRRPIEALVRRRPGPMHLLVGGRHFSAAGDPPVVLTLAIAGTPVETWTVDPAPGGVSFLRFIDLPGGIPPVESEYVPLTITARAEPASAAHAASGYPPVRYPIQRHTDLRVWRGMARSGIRQRNRPVLALDQPTAQSCECAAPQAVVIRLRGESPLKYFDVEPTVRISAGDRIVGEFASSTPTSRGR